MASVSKKVLIDAPLETTFSIGTDPSRWGLWYVGLTDPEKMEGDGGAGTVTEHSYVLAGMRFPVTNVVEECELTAQGGRWKAQVQGPLAGWHTWTYTPKGEQTEVSVQMEYTLPGSVLGKIADALFVERVEERSMEQTLQNLKHLIEGSQD